MKKKHIEMKRKIQKYSPLNINNLCDATQKDIHYLLLLQKKIKNRMYLNIFTRSFVNHKLPSNPKQYHRIHPRLPIFP